MNAPRRPGSWEDAAVFLPELRWSAATLPFLLAPIDGTGAGTGPTDGQTHDAQIMRAVRMQDGTTLSQLLSDARAASPETLGAALFLGASNGAVAICRALLDARADPNYANDIGETPLMVAAGKGHVEVVSVLLARGSLVDQQSHARRTALFYAAAGNRLKPAELLLRAGADARRVDVEGKTPLALARSRPVAFRLPVWGAFVEGRVPRLRRTPLDTLLRTYGS